MRRRYRRKNDADGGLILAILCFVIIGSLSKNNIAVIVCLLVAVPAISVSYRYYKKEKEKQRYLNSGMKDVDNLTGEEFEYFLCTYFKALGYKAKVTPPSNDYGADVIAEKDGVKIVIQAKRYKGNVGIKAVQEVIGAKGYYNAQKAMVVTCAYFTPNAKNLATECHVELWDRDKLKNVMEQIQGKELVDKMKNEDDFKVLDRTCPLCGSGLVMRHGKRGDFYGCQNFPDCKYTKQL